MANHDEQKQGEGDGTEKEIQSQALGHQVEGHDEVPGDEQKTEYNKYGLITTARELAMSDADWSRIDSHHGQPDAEAGDQIARHFLARGLLELVKASILGSILGNLLLILGLSLFAGGLHSPLVRFNRTAAGMATAMLALAVLGLTVPALYHGLHPEALATQELHLSEAVAVILAITYLLSLWFSLKTHSRLFSGEPHPVTGPVWGKLAAVGVLAAATVGIALESEILVHTVEPMTASIGLTQTFVGLILLPLVGNVADHATAVLVARNGKMDLALHFALASSTHIALLVAPLFVLVGLVLVQELNLAFAPIHVTLVGLSTAFVAIITLDGESHWFEGVQLLAVYAMIVVAVLFI